MEYRPQEVKAGIIVVISAIIFIVFLISISGLDLNKSTKQFTKCKFISQKIQLKQLHIGFVFLIHMS